MCLPTNTRPRRHVLANVEPCMMKTKGSQLFTLSMVSGIKQNTIDKCEPPKRRESMLTSTFAVIPGTNTVMNWYNGPSAVYQDANRFEPPLRRASISSTRSCTDDSEDTSSDNFELILQGKQVADFLSKSLDKHLKKLRRHEDVHGIFQDD